MGNENLYPEGVQRILDMYGAMIVAHPKTGETAPLVEALPLCVEEDGQNHLLNMLAEMSVQEAGVVLKSFVPEQ